MTLQMIIFHIIMNIFYANIRQPLNYFGQLHNNSLIFKFLTAIIKIKSKFKQEMQKHVDKINKGLPLMAAGVFSHPMLSQMQDL